MIDLKSTELKAIWVLENAKIDRKMWMNDLEFFYLMASVIQWKKFHPNVPCYLICTSEVYDFLAELDVIYIFDGVDIEILAEEDQIDREPFWACSKIKAMRKISVPFALIDCDFYFKQRLLIDSDFENDLIVSHKEDGVNYYILSDDPLIEKAGITDTYPKDIDGKSFNVSFLYIKNDSFKQKYVDTAYDWMTKLSRLEDKVHGGYMVFCEQKLLYDMAEAEGLRHKTLITDVYNCRGQKFHTHSASQSKIDHLGPLKRHLQPSQENYIMRKANILNSIRDYNNLKHLFNASKRLDQWKTLNDGKFYLSEKLNPWIAPTPLHHQNDSSRSICVVYTLWQEKKYLSYLKYSLISLMISTDVNQISDILIFTDESTHSIVKGCLDNIISEDCIVMMDFTPFKYGVITHPRLKEYEQIVLMDTDLFIMGKHDLFSKIQNYYNTTENRKIFMMPTEEKAQKVFWDRKKNLCKSLNDEEYLQFYIDNTGEAATYFRDSNWWISPMVIYNNRYHFREPDYARYVFENLWNRQMCDETVFIMWAQKENYKIESTNFFIHVKDRYQREIHSQIKGYHPIVGVNTTDPSNEEMIKQIERNYEEYLKKI